MASFLRRRPSPTRFSSTKSQHQNGGVRRRSAVKPKNKCDIEVPSKFGNAADYWKHFDQVAGAHNDELVESMNQNLDLLMVFGGLFAGVNSGFLAFALPMLSADPAAETNHLLRLLVTRGSNQTGLTESDLLPPEFTPDQDAIRLTRLFSVSLTLTLLASFGAMVGKQWIIYYTRGSQGGPSEAESRRLQKKLAGVNRCGLRLLVELALPSLLQIALFVFSVGVIAYLGTLNTQVAWVNAILAWLGVAAFGVTVIHAVWDPYCPFQTPISQFIWFTISLPFNIIPGIIVMVVKRFPASLIRKATGGLFKSFTSNWRHPFTMAKTETQILTNTLDSSYLRTLTHRLKFNSFNRVVSHIRRQEDPNDVMDAKYACHLLRTTEQPQILRAVAQSIPALFDRRAMSRLLKDRAVIHLHRLFRSSIAQAEDAPGALVQDSDDTSKPAINAMLYGRAVMHLFIALGPHDDWFWDDYEGDLNRGWLDPWDLDDADKSLPDSVIAELEQQRWIIQACLSVGPDSTQPSGAIEESALPLYIAANIKALLHRRIYHHLAHYPPKFRPTVSAWKGEDQLESMAYTSEFPQNYPKTIGLVAWALATLPTRTYQRDIPILDKYKMFWADVKALWDAYSNESSILRNVSKALDMYPHLTNSQDLDLPYPPANDLNLTYRNMLRATTQYVNENATNEAIRDWGPSLAHSIGTLQPQITDEVADGEESMGDLLQSLVGAVIHRHGQHLRQHVRGASGSGDESGMVPALEREWLRGNAPNALDEYRRWITTDRAASPGSIDDPEELFYKARDQMQGSQEQVIHIDTPLGDETDGEKQTV